MIRVADILFAAAGLCLFSFVEWRKVDNDETKWELFKAWQRLGELFPVFEKECDWQKFVSVVSCYQSNWAPFSGSGRKMVKVFVSDRASSKASAVQKRDLDTGQEFPQGIEARDSSWHTVSPLGEITPPTRGRSPLSVLDQGGRQTKTVVDLLVAAGALSPPAGVISLSAGMYGSTFHQVQAPAHPSAGVVATYGTAARRESAISVNSLLSPAPTASRCQEQADHLHEVPSPLKCCGGDDEVGCRRPVKARKVNDGEMAGDKEDPLHLLLDALTKQA